MANGAGTPAATPNPFGPQQQPSTPMGGGASPLNTGGGMSGQNQTVGTMGGFGGNLGTAGTMGGQQNTIGTMGGFGGNLGTARTLGGQQNNVPQFAQNYLQQQQMGQQNSPALTMMPQNQGPYTAPISQPISAEQALNNSPNMSPAVLGNMGSFFQQQQMGQQPQQQMGLQPSQQPIQSNIFGGMPYSPQDQQRHDSLNAQSQVMRQQMEQQRMQQPLQAPQQVAQPLPQQQPDLNTAMGQIKGGDQFAAQNTMRQLVGLPPLQAPAYNANPTMSDVQQLLQSGDKASAQSMMQRMVGLPASSPAPAITAPAAPQGIQSLMQARPIRRPLGRGRR